MGTVETPRARAARIEAEKATAEAEARDRVVAVVRKSGPGTSRRGRTKK